MIARILAPVDGCDQSEAVLPYVEELSHRLSANVTLLHVFPPSLHSQQDIHAQYITALADDLRGRLRHHDVDVRGVVLEGKPSREIVDFAAQADIGLIAAGLHTARRAGATGQSEGQPTRSYVRQVSLSCSPGRTPALAPGRTAS